MEYVYFTLFEVTDNVSPNSTNPTDKYTFNYPLIWAGSVHTAL